jgi:Rieske Fe-S protein
MDQAPTDVSGEILLGTVDEIPVGTGKKVMVDESLTILVTHPKQDQFRAFSATCTHSGCIVSGVQDGQIACGCHGARFNTDSGEPEQGPARLPLGKITVEVRGNELYALL